MKPFLDHACMSICWNPTNKLTIRRIFRTYSSQITESKRDNDRKKGTFYLNSIILNIDSHDLMQKIDFFSLVQYSLNPSLWSVETPTIWVMLRLFHLFWSRRDSGTERMTNWLQKCVRSSMWKLFLLKPLKADHYYYGITGKSLWNKPSVFSLFASMWLQTRFVRYITMKILSDSKTYEICIHKMIEYFGWIRLNVESFLVSANHY